MFFVGGIVGVLILYILRDLIAHTIVFVTGNRVEFEGAQRGVAIVFKTIVFLIALLCTAVLWKVGILDAFGKAFGVIFQNLWDLLMMFPLFLTWLIS